MKEVKRPLGSIILYFLMNNFIVLIPLYIMVRLGVNTFYDSNSFKSIYLLYFDVLLIFILFMWHKKDLIRDFKNFKLEYIETGFKCWIFGAGIMVVSNILLQILLPDTPSNNQVIIEDQIKQLPLYMIFSTVIYAPFIEELLFRKCFKDIFYNKWFFIIFSGFIFGSLHIVSSMESLWALFHIIPYGVLGASFAYLYFKTKNIFSSIVMHAMHNGVLVGVLIFTTFFAR